MRRHVLAGQHIERRQEHRGISGFDNIGERLEQRQKRFRLLVTIDDDQLGTPRSAMQQRRIERFRRQREPG
jgi:hypothetical protein